MVELGGVGLDAHDRRLRRERCGLAAGLADVEPRADDEHDVGVLDRQARVLVAGVAVEAERQRVVAGQRAEPEQAVRDRDAALAHEPAQLLGRACQQNALARDDQRPLRAGQRRGGRVERLGGDRRRRALALRRLGGLVDLAALDVHRQVDDHRPGATLARGPERALDRRRHLVRMPRQDLLLGDRAHQRDRVDLLEAALAHRQVAAHVAGADLPGADDQRRGVEVRVGDGGDEVRHARAGGDEHDLRPPAQSRAASAA